MTSIDDVHREFGSAAETAQLLETELGTILFKLRGEDEQIFGGDRELDARAILDRINSSTLGTLIRGVQTKSHDFDHLAEQVAKALAERNRLSHHFYRQHNFRRNTDEGRGLMLTDLEQIHDAIMVAYKLVLKVVGFDLDALAGSIAAPTKHLKLD